MSEEISQNICKTGEFVDALFFEAICSCGSDNHQQCLCVEYDEEVQEVSLIIYSKIVTPEFINWNVRYECQKAFEEGNYWKSLVMKCAYILNHIWVKLKFTKSVWLNGYVESQGTFSFKNNKAIDDYLLAISAAKEKILAFKEKQKNGNGNRTEVSTKA